MSNFTISNKKMRQVKDPKANAPQLVALENILLTGKVFTSSNTDTILELQWKHVYDGMIWPTKKNVQFSDSWKWN